MTKDKCITINSPAKGEINDIDQETPLINGSQ